MPLLREEADKLTIESLQKGVIEVLITRGARELLGKLPFKSFQGTAYTFVAEKALPDSASIADPYGNTIATGVGSYNRIPVASGSFMRNADTAVIDTIGKSNINKQRRQDTIRAAKALSRDFMDQFINGTHVVGADVSLEGLEHWLDFYAPDFPEQTVYATDAGTAADYGNAQALSLTLLDDLLTRFKGDGFDCIVSNRETQVAFQNLLNLAGGNTAGMFMEDKFGKMYWAYRGTPWHVFDVVGQAKRTTPGDAQAGIAAGSATVVAGGTLTVTDPRFVGFSSIDVGRAVSVNGVAQGVIDSVTSNRVVEVSAAVAATGALEVAKTNAIYCIRFDEEDGTTALYHEGRGNAAENGEYEGPISGFDAEDLGRLESSEKLRTRLTWYGSFAVQSPHAIARLSHFTV